MNSIDAVFQAKDGTYGKAFIPFITAGDPDIDTTERLIYAMAEAGADLIELGLPFSDPIAEGPVIQEASFRALSNGMTTDKLFALIQKVRQKTDAALAIMTYANAVYGYGSGRFLQKASENGVCALIIPDLPFEEKEELQPYCTQYGVKLISFIAPSSHERIAMIAKEAEGFLYCVSSMGVTGVRSEITTDLGAMVAGVKAVKNIPCAIGFGISTPEQAKQMAGVSDGVIVGSAIVKMIAKHGTDSVPYVAEYVRKMKQALLEADCPA